MGKEDLLNRIKHKISEIEINPFIQNKNKYVFDEMIQLLYNHSEGDLLPVFMIIDKLSKEDHKKEIEILYQGLQDGMHNTASISKYLLEEKTSRQAKDYAKWIFKNDEGNIAHMIRIAMAYFKDGTDSGASNNGKWFFQQFLSLLKENKDKYLEGGSSHEWAKHFKYLDYIKLVLEKNQ